MARKAGSADLPLHGGQVPKRLADRMTRLGTVMSQAIIHHYGRDELLRRLAHPTSPLASLSIPGLEPMEAKLMDDLPEEAGWQFEPKWDGFRCLAFRAGDDVYLRAKSGKPLARYFPDVVAQLKELPFTQFVIDGELAIQEDDDLSFAARAPHLRTFGSRWQAVCPSVHPMRSTCSANDEW